MFKKTIFGIRQMFRFDHYFKPIIIVQKRRVFRLHRTTILKCICNHTKMNVIVFPNDNPGSPHFYISFKCACKISDIGICAQFPYHCILNTGDLQKYVQLGFLHCLKCPRFGFAFMFTLLSTVCPVPPSCPHCPLSWKPKFGHPT